MLNVGRGLGCACNGGSVRRRLSACPAWVSANCGTLSELASPFLFDSKTTNEVNTHINIEVPSFLAEKRVLGLDLSLIVAGTNTAASSRSASRPS